MSYTLLLQYTKWRIHTYGGTPPTDSEHWKYWGSRAKWLAVVDDYADPTAIRVGLERMTEIVTGDDYVGVSDAYWRLIWIDNDDVGQRPHLIAGPVPQSAKTTAKDVEATLDIALVEPEPLPQLDATKVPSGTVVQILDEWGLPINTTEVI